MDFFEDIRWAFLPELIIIGFIFINVFLALFFKKKFYKTSQWIAIFGILASFASIGFIQAEPTYYAFNNSLVSNVYTVFFKSLILVASFFVVLLSNKIVQKRRAQSFEYFAVLFAGILGALMFVSANDFLVLYFAFGLLGISCSLLISSFKKFSAKNTGLKYLINDIIASGMLALGVSYLYILTKEINFDLIADSLIGYQGGLLLAFAVILIVSGVMFKIIAVPFIGWLPCVYKGTDYSVAAFLSLIPVISGFSVLSRILLVFSDYVPLLGVVVVIFGLMSIFIGGYGAIKENDVKRFMGCSSTIHSGFILLVLGVINVYNIAGMLYYLICYLFINIAMWAGLINNSILNRCDDLASFKGVAFSRPFYSLAMVFVLMGLIGLPPTSGFLAKLFILSAVAKLGFMYVIFLLIALLLSVIAMIAYLRFIAIMFESNHNNLRLNGKTEFSKITMYFCTIVTILLCFYSSKIVELCELIAYSL